MTITYVHNIVYLLLDQEDILGSKREMLICKGQSSTLFSRDDCLFVQIRVGTLACKISMKPVVSNFVSFMRYIYQIVCEMRGKDHNFVRNVSLR